MLPSSTSTSPIDAATRQQAIERAITELTAQYIFPEIAQQVAVALSDNLQNNRYDRYDQAVAFAEALTSDLRAITKDKHFSVFYSIEPIPERPAESTKPSAEEEVRYRCQAEQENFGIERVERLPGNLGYIDLRAFHDLSLSAEAITAAMTLVAHTAALIIDLRKNDGGDPLTVAFMTTYLIDERTHLNSFQLRVKGSTDQFLMEQFWTHAWVPGKRYGQRKPVYVLTSANTFSGAEEFSYNLKTLQRATLIGETTGGGANPGDIQRLTAHFQMFIPNGRAVNPITNTNWEGVGVEPDVKVAADDALRVAQVMALKQIAESEPDVEQTTRRQERLAELARASQ